MDQQPVPSAAGSPASSTSSWHSAFDPPSETLSPKQDRKRSKNVASKKTKKMHKRKKKSEKTSRALRQSQDTAQPSADNPTAPTDSFDPQQQDFDDPVFDLLCKTKEERHTDPALLSGYKGRGVAKMMSRSGLRCKCHYVRSHLCPLKLLADEFGFTHSTSASLEKEHIVSVFRKLL